MINSTEQKKLSAAQAQRCVYDFILAVRRHVDIAASARSKPRDIARAMRRLDRALAVLEGRKKSG